MAFNPRTKIKDGVPVEVKPAMTGTSPGVVVTGLMKISDTVKSGFAYRGKPVLKPIEELKTRPAGEKDKFIIEYWRVGDPESDIVRDEFHIHPLSVKTFIAGLLRFGKYTLVYLERVKDGKVIYDRRYGS